jgi:GrpB-like predicted nucleotidyltransferase (UPF0157 family)
VSAHSAPLGLRRGTVRLATADQRWPDLFLAEADRLAEAVRRAGLAPLRLEHVGSTSVPGLVSKPILDMMAGSSPGADRQPYPEVFAALGYEPRGPQGVAHRELLVLGPEHARTHHLNLVVAGGAFWRDHLVFRDRLRSDPRLARLYAALKLELARRHSGHREAYSAGKAAFVHEVVLGPTSETAGEVERTAGPMLNLVEMSGASDPERLGQFRRQYEALVAPYFESNVVRQDYLLTRAIKA